MPTKLLASFARFVHFSNVLIAIATVALCLQTALLLDWLFIPNWFYVLMFCITILQYGLLGLFAKKDTANAKPKPGFWNRNPPYFIGTIVIAALVTAYLFFHLKWLQIYWFILIWVLTLACRFPILPIKLRRRFRQNDILKLLVLVIVWTVSTTVLPATFIPYGFDKKFYWLLAFRFLFTLAICIPFDVRGDITDIKTARRTMVSLMGEKLCYRLAYLCLLIGAILLIQGYYLDVPIYYLIALLLSLIATAWMVDYNGKHMFSTTSYIIPGASMILQTVLVCTAILIP